jgi:hypothetical protein
MADFKPVSSWWFQCSVIVWFDLIRWRTRITPILNKNELQVSTVFKKKTLILSKQRLFVFFSLLVLLFKIKSQLDLLRLIGLVVEIFSLWEWEVPNSIFEWALARSCSFYLDGKFSSNCLAITCRIAPRLDHTRTGHGAFGITFSSA